MLREHYIGKGRPRIVSLYITLTSLKKAETETVTEYIIRAEQIFTALRGAGEAPSEGLMMAMIMRGLPEKYKPFYADGNPWFSGDEAGGVQGEATKLRGFGG